MTIEELEQLSKDETAQKKAEAAAKEAKAKAREAAKKANKAEADRLSRAYNLQATIAKNRAEALRVIRSQEYDIDPSRKEFVQSLLNDTSNKEKELANLEAQFGGYRGMGASYTRISGTGSSMGANDRRAQMLQSTLTPTPTPTPTGTDTGIGTDTGTGTGTGTGINTSSASATTTEAAGKAKQINRWQESTQIQKLGINEAVVQYMKENYPNDWAKIKAQIDNALQDKNLTQPELDRITVEFKKSDYYKKAQVEKNRTKIGAYFIENGLDTISNAAEIDRLTSDVFVRKVNTLEQAQAEIRRTSAERLGLLNSLDENKRKIGAAMIDGGQSFRQAANPYIAAYAALLDIPVNEFDPFEDSSFLNAFNNSTSFADFQVKAKSDSRYIMSLKGRQEMDQTKLGLQRLTRALGLGYNPQQLESQAQNIVSGKTTFEQIEYSLRSIAGEAFPSFKDRILAGDTIENIASPYVSSMSRILEIPDGSIDISDPNNEIRKALIGDGKIPKPLWQFEQDLFKDARWQYTSNARDTVDRVSMDIMQRFGVMG